MPDHFIQLNLPYTHCICCIFSTIGNIEWQEFVVKKQSCQVSTLVLNLIFKPTTLTVRTICVNNACDIVNFAE